MFGAVVGADQDPGGSVAVRVSLRKREGLAHSMKPACNFSRGSASHALDELSGMEFHFRGEVSPMGLPGTLGRTDPVSGSERQPYAAA